MTEAAKPDGISERLAADLAAWGATPAVPSPIRKAVPRPTISVCDAAWPTVLLFVAMETQWRIVMGFGGIAYLGLDYAQADVLMRHEPDLADASLRDLQIMEAEALTILNSGD